MTKKKKEELKANNPPAPSSDDGKKQKKAQRDANGRFVKGHQKEGGRIAGTPNRNGNIRDRLKQQLEPIIDELLISLLKVAKEEGTAEMLKTAEKFMPYVYPKLQSMSLSADQNRPISEEQRLLELDAMYTKKELSINFKTMTVVDNDKARELAAGEDDFDLSKFQVVDNG